MAIHANRQIFRKKRVLLMFAMISTYTSGAIRTTVTPPWYAVCHGIYGQNIQHNINTYSANKHLAKPQYPSCAISIDMLYTTLVP